MTAVLSYIAPRLFLLFLCDLFYISLLWASDLAALSRFRVAVLLFNLIYITLVIAAALIRKARLKAKIDAFLRNSESGTEALRSELPSLMLPLLDAVSDIINTYSRQMTEWQTEKEAYGRYVDEWAHEIKTPLALAALLLGNRQNEMSPYVHERMNHISRRISEDVDRILFYSRIDSGRPDFHFSSLRLDRLLEDCLYEFSFVFKESGVEVEAELPPCSVVSDKKSLSFIINQLLSNASKYAPRDGGRVFVSIVPGGEGGMSTLTVRNNGGGVAPEDAPFIFDIGFCGGEDRRQRVTGMGLYLAKRYADAIGAVISLSPESTKGEYFEIMLGFPANPMPN